MSKQITLEEFKKLDIRVAKVAKVEEIEGADKLFKLALDVGDIGERTVVAGIKGHYQKDELKGRLVVYLSNLEPKEFMGVMSQGMILAADDDGPVLLQPEKDVIPGAEIR